MAIPAVDRAKRPISPLAGPYGHPFHPILATIPIGAWVASLVFDIATKVDSAGSTAFVNASYWLIAIGVVGAVLAAVFGLMDLLTIPRSTKALRIGLTHMTLNLTVVGIFIGDFFWRHASASGSNALAKVQTGQLVLSAVAIGLLFISGFLGGTLTYHYGVRVADEAAQAENF